MICIPSKKKILTLITVTIITAAEVTTSQVQTQNNPSQTPPQTPPRKFTGAEKAEYESQFPVVDYEPAQSEDADKRQKRRGKNRRFDGRGMVARPETSGEDQATTRFNDWEMQLPPLPAAQSDVVVISEVLDAKAYLSNDKSGVYSEFSLRADEVLMESGEPKITPGGMIVAEREGGRVRFPSGIIELYEIAGQGMPRPGRRYVLFLKATGEEQSYSIVTGYEVLGNRILPLDKRGVGKSKFGIYRDMNLNDFLQAVRSAIAQSRQTQKGGTMQVVCTITVPGFTSVNLLIKTFPTAIRWIACLL